MSGAAVLPRNPCDMDAPFDAVASVAWTSVVKAGAGAAAAANGAIRADERLREVLGDVMKEQT